MGVFPGRDTGCAESGCFPRVRLCIARNDGHRCNGYVTSQIFAGYVLRHKLAKYGKYVSSIMFITSPVYYFIQT